LLGRESDHIDWIVKQWQRERPDLDVSALELLGRLFRVAQLAEIVLSEKMADRGLQPGWFDLLAALRRAGRPFELRPTDLMAATMVSSGGITKRLDRDDRRGTLIRLTRRGRAVIDRALTGHIANEERLLRPLTATDRNELDRLLRRLLAGLGPAQPD
jgi:hypothetical protein